MLSAIDHAILQFINGYALKSWSFDIIIQVLERNRFTKGAIIVAIYWYLWFLREEKVKVIERRKTILASIIGAMTGVFFTVFLTKILPYRVRPLHDPDVHLLIPPGSEDILRGWSAFPSDTATLISGLAVGIFLVSRKVGIFAIVYAMVIVMLPRIYLGLHYPTDILGGIVIGTFFVIAANGHTMKNLLADKLLAFSEESPGIFFGLLFLLTYELGSLFLDLRDIGRTSSMILKTLSYRLF